MVDRAVLLKLVFEYRFFFFYFWVEVVSKVESLVRLSFFLGKIMIIVNRFLRKLLFLNLFKLFLSFCCGGFYAELSESVMLLLS